MQRRKHALQSRVHDSTRVFTCACVVIETKYRSCVSFDACNHFGIISFLLLLNIKQKQMMLTSVVSVKYAPKI